MRPEELCGTHILYTHKACVTNALPASLCYAVCCRIFKIMEIAQLDFYFWGGGRGAANQSAIMKVVLCHIEFNAHVIKFYCRYDFYSIKQKKNSRKFKYKGYFTSLSFSILKNLRAKKDGGM